MGTKFINLPSKTSSEKPKHAVCDGDLTTKPTAVSGGFPRKQNDLLPDLKIVSIPISDNKKSDHRVRKESNNSIRKIIPTITKFGVRKPVILTSEFELIDGHALMEGAVQLGIKTIPCIIASDLSEAEIRALRIALNKTQELGDWDNNVLRVSDAPA